MIAIRLGQIEASTVTAAISLPQCIITELVEHNKTIETCTVEIRDNTYIFVLNEGTIDSEACFIEIENKICILPNGLKVLFAYGADYITLELTITDDNISYKINKILRSGIIIEHPICFSLAKGLNVFLQANFSYKEALTFTGLASDPFQDKIKRLAKAAFKHTTDISVKKVLSAYLNNKKPNFAMLEDYDFDAISVSDVTESKIEGQKLTSSSSSQATPNRKHATHSSPQLISILEEKHAHTKQGILRIIPRRVECYVLDIGSVTSVACFVKPTYKDRKTDLLLVPDGWKILVHHLGKDLIAETKVFNHTMHYQFSEVDNSGNVIKSSGWNSKSPTSALVAINGKVKGDNGQAVIGVTKENAQKFLANIFRNRIDTHSSVIKELLQTFVTQIEEDKIRPRIQQDIVAAEAETTSSNTMPTAPQRDTASNIAVVRAFYNKLFELRIQQISAYNDLVSSQSQLFGYNSFVSQATAAASHAQAIMVGSKKMKPTFE